MLLSLEKVFARRMADPAMALVMAMVGAHPREIAPGIYTDCGYNFENAVESRAGRDFLVDWPELPNWKSTYGVADSIEQITAFYAPEIADTARFYAIGLTEVRRAEQPMEGGWRWHKWGEYIGTRRPTAEYLHDEPEIESVLTFSLIEIAKPEVLGVTRPLPSAPSPEERADG